jgi:hypothetical protein
MAILQQNINYNNARFPQPKRRILQPIVFPNDLIVDRNRDFYTHISFKEYNFTGDILPGIFPGGFGDLIIQGINFVRDFSTKQINSLGITFKPSENIGDVLLPLPKKINDNTVLSWNDQSVLEKVAAVDPTGMIGKTSAVIATSSFMGGVTINPFLFMFFQRPNFKEFVLQWTLTPNTVQESRTAISIINKLKKASLPTKTGFGFLLKYPHIVQIDLFPNELKQHLTFKPCAITAVQADYTASGAPSFFKGTKLPTVITLSLSLKEIELWDSSEIRA